MPAPLLWLGAAALGIYAGNELNNEYLKRKGVLQQLPKKPRNAWAQVEQAPVNGSVVCCGVYGVLDHTGIWVDGNIYELNGNGLVRCVSPDRFLQNRSGDDIYVLCDENERVLSTSAAVERAKSQLFHVKEYHLFRQNCHRFVAEMLSGQSQKITSFSDLNQFLHKHYHQTLCWLPASIQRR